MWHCPNMNVTGLHWWSVNIGSGNGLRSSGNKPLPGPTLTQIRRHMVSPGHNVLISPRWHRTLSTLLQFGLTSIRYLNKWWFIVDWTSRNKLDTKWFDFYSTKWIWKCRIRNGGHFFRLQCVCIACPDIASIYHSVSVGLRFVGSRTGITALVRSRVRESWAVW